MLSTNKLTCLCATKDIYSLGQSLRNYACRRRYCRAVRIVKDMEPLGLRHPVNPHKQSLFC